MAPRDLRSWVSFEKILAALTRFPGDIPLDEQPVHQGAWHAFEAECEAAFDEIAPSGCHDRILAMM